MDILSLMGLVLGFGAILVGQHLEGGHLNTLINGPAFLIVIGGTVGAVMLQTSWRNFRAALGMLAWIWKPPVQDQVRKIAQIVEWSNVARREGLLGLESMAETEKDQFARRGLQLLVDGSEPGSIRTIMETEIHIKEQEALLAAKVYEGMGGYAPTVGILGAVMGLIHVMNNLTDPSKLGGGIAVAFVATIYGVGFANLLCLPLANKLKNVVRKRAQFQELIVDGIVSIAEGENPRNIELKLNGYIN